MILEIDLDLLPTTEFFAPAFHRASDSQKLTQHVRAQNVEYLTLNRIRHKTVATEQLPFLKRYPFTDEREFRIICESPMKRIHALDIPIPLPCIDKIILRPWLPQGFSEMSKGC
jgi:hypothetical protein